MPREKTLVNRVSNTGREEYEQEHVTERRNKGTWYALP